MPNLSDAIRYADSPATGEEELRRACDILLLANVGSSVELRARLLQHLTTLAADRPVVCLNPGAVAPRRGRAGPRLRRPEPSEFAVAFADEIALVPDASDFAEMLATQLDITRALAATFGEAHASLRYAPDKWSVRETIGHLADCERVLSYRMLRALRGDEGLVAGFDHVGYVGAGQFESRALADVVDEFVAVRGATVALVQSAGAAKFAVRLRVGGGTITGTALAYLIAGHERHHQSLLRTRYLACLTV